MKKKRSEEHSNEDSNNVNEFTEADTKELRDYINELGFDQLNVEKPVKKKGKKKLNKSKGKGTDFQTNAVEQPMQKPAKMIHKSKKKSLVPHIQQEVQMKGPYEAKMKPSIAPKITVNDRKDRPNKKIVFDSSYISEPKPETSSSINSKEKVSPFPKIQKINNSKNNEEWYKLLIEPDKPWFQQVKKLKSDGNTITGSSIQNLQNEAGQLLEEDISNFHRVRKIGADKSETKWMDTMMRSGTFSDKIAAHSVLLEQSVPHNLSSLRYLISLLNIKGRRECMASLDSLLPLLTGGKILNPSSKLVSFINQPLSLLSKLATGERKKQLALWSFEDQLKELYGEILKALDGLLKDAVEATRRKAISAIAILLSYSPEQEQLLLTQLVNKVGDPNRRVATNAVSQLERLLQKHGNMKPVVVSEVERLLYRPHINARAQYYALCFLSQILLDPDDIQLATSLIVIYVSFFKACVKKGEVDSKLMAALLTGIKRAYPYTKAGTFDGGPLIDHIGTLFKLVHMVHFGLAVQALCILDQVVENGQTTSDRFYSVLFRKLLDPELAHCTKQSMFLNLVYRALKRDDSLDRLRAFIKRILQICLVNPPHLVCGFLYLVSELFKTKPVLRKLVAENKTFITEDDDEEDEHYEDMPDELDEQLKITPEVEDKGISWMHRKNLGVKEKSNTNYDPLARNPLYAHAEQSGGFWELNLLVNHYHPSVSLFAKTITEQSSITYTGDPLQDFVLTRFLDRFVFRNPKQIQTTETHPPAQRRVLGKRHTYIPQGIRALAVDSKEFLHQSADAIPVDEMFLYQYFQRRSETRGSRPQDEDDDISSVGSEEFERFLDEQADLDFAADIKPKSKPKKKQNEDDEMGSEDNDLEAAECSSDEELEKDEEFKHAFDEFDDMINEVDEEDEEQSQSGGIGEEDVAFSDEEGEEDPMPKTKSNKRTREAFGDLDWTSDSDPIDKNKRHRQLPSDMNSDFVGAEEFAAMLEQNATPGLDTTGTSEAFANKDKANVKQLQWEMQRDRWIKDRNRPRKGGKFKSGSNKRRPVRGRKR